MTSAKNDAHGKKSSLQLPAVAILMLVAMTTYETLKQIILPNITLWQSHIVTILFGALSATIVSFLFLRRHRKAEMALAKRTEQLEAVRVVSVEITRELDLSRLLELITRRAVEFARASTGMLRLWDAPSEMLVPQSWVGIGGQGGLLRVRLGEGVAGSAAGRREALIVNDFRQSPYATPQLLGLTAHHAVLAEPLIYRDRLVGVLSVTHDEEGRFFKNQDAQILSLFAAQAAIAMENARLHAAALRRSQELEAVLKANHAIESSLDLDTRLCEIVRQAAAITGVAAARILLLDENGQVLRLTSRH